MRVQTGTIRGVPEGMDAVEKVRAEQVSYFTYWRFSLVQSN